LKICILYGGSSNERAVSLASLEMIFKNLSKEKYDIELVELPGDRSADWAKRLVNNPPDMVLSALHGGSGENGSVQGLLECLNIPYIGSKVLSSALCMDKQMAKIVMEAAHIPCAEGVFIRSHEDFNRIDSFISNCGLPVVVKPNNGGSSIGIKIAQTQAEIMDACHNIFNMGDSVLMEKYYHGMEVTCALIERNGQVDILGILDIVPGNQFYDYEAKYQDESTYIGLSELPTFIQNMIEEIGRKAFKALGCKGYARLDMIVYNEQVMVIEMNTLPGLTAHSLIPKAAMHLDGGFAGLLDMLIYEEMSGK